MEKESTGERGKGVSYKGRQGQTKRTVELQEEEEEEEEEEKEEEEEEEKKKKKKG
jgi:hypothetical protein